MTSTQHHARRGVTALLCLYVIFINGLAMGNPPDVDASGNGASSPQGIAYYANDSECYRVVKEISAIAHRAQNIWLDLAAIPLDLCECHLESPDEKLQNELMTYFYRIGHDYKVYTDIEEMFDEYHNISRETQKKFISRKRLAELSNMMQNLEERFQGMEKMLDTIDVNAVPGFDEDRVQKATEFIAKDKVRTQSHSSGPVPEKVSGASNDKEATQPADDVTGNNPEGETSFVCGASCARPVIEGGLTNIPRNGSAIAYLTDPSLFTRMETLQPDAQTIVNILSTRSTPDAYLRESMSDYNSLDDETKQAIIKVDNELLGQMQNIINAWDMFKRYNDISNMLSEMNPESPEAMELVRKRSIIESSFVFYVPLFEDDALTYIEEVVKHYKLTRLNSAGQVECNNTSQSTDVRDENAATADAPETKPIESVSNNMRSASNKKDNSGYMIMATKGICAIVALCLTGIL